MIMVTRKNFIKDSLLLSAAMLLSPKTLLGKSLGTGRKLKLEKDDVILFYGDSITDGNHNREITAPSKPDGLGGGYVMSVSSYLAEKYPRMNFNFYNRGINGNKTFQMIDRLDTDCFGLKYKPTVVSVLTGINDYSLSLRNTGKGNPAEYEAKLAELLDRIKAGLPGVRLIVLEPYAIAGVREKTDSFLPGFYEYQPIAEKVAEKEGAVFIPLQKHFDEAGKKYGKEKFSRDGVHPWSAGIELITRAWIDAVEV